MATQVTNYQCPACTGPLHFEGASGKLECEYCGTAYEVAEIEALYAEKEAQAEAAAAEAPVHKEEETYTSPDGGWSDEESAGMKAYSCPSCGAEIICDETTAATSCVYCGNPTVIPGQFSGAMRPDYVIPFKLDKEAAVAALKKYYRGKMLLPRAFASTAHIEEIQGIYVPFWLYDGAAECSASFDATRSHSYTQGDYRITETEHFLVQREGSFSYERIPADGSTKMPDAHMDSIEPFDYSELKPFSTAYLPGYLAEKYDVSAQENAKRINERVKGSAEQLLLKTVLGYHTVATRSNNTSIHAGSVKYAMLPVWLLHTKWNGGSYLFAMNGQTGKLIGDLPVSKGKFAAWMAGIAAPLMAILAVLLLL
ncbi:MAG: hypothetical protein IIY16_05370 [Oscillospiraceae bacterium]|nr:hypothetical protein [Oscillospiraceae bacterium]